ncbi:MAG: GEVED domain-containing protein [Prevotellaceae bacterium]|jgi:endo-beta-N-acetylglucosaminidase D|nr:GEVED domain-containing protein [Prevotellaceae bacterium]
MKRLLFMLVASLFVLQPLCAQRQSYVDWKNQDMDSLLMWFKDGVPTDLSKLKDLEFKRSHVRPRTVIVDRATQLDTSIDPRRTVFANLPIGADDLLTGLPSGNFDEDVFSMWPYVKVHGNWSNPFFSAPGVYSDAAHKHGVSVLSSWFFGWYWEYAAGKTKAEDGDAYKVELMTKKDAQGNYIYAKTMMDIMQYFGMDGINYNSETIYKGAAAEMQGLHSSLYSLAKERSNSSFHVGWYNGASSDGEGRGSRTSLSNSNDKWYYNADKKEFVSDAFMLDYGWGTTELNSTVSRANTVGAPNGALDVYAGMWLVDIRSSYFPALDAQKGVSIGLWGEHKNNRFFNHRSGDDLGGIQKSYQDRLEWFFTGKTQNPKDAKSNATYGVGGGVDNDAYLQNFHGLAKHVAERSAVQGSLPFATNFNLGNGIYYYDRGVKTLGQWYNLSAQDMTPTYRWLITDQSGAAAANVKARFSHDDSWMGGSSLLLEGTASSAPTDVTLYRTLLTTKKQDAYSAKPATPKNFSTESYNECATKVNLKMVWSMSDENAARLVYNDEVNVDHFEIFVKRSGGEPQKVAHTASWAHFLPDLKWGDAEQSFEVGVRAVAQDLVTASDVAWTTVTRDPAAAAVSCGGGGDYCEGITYVTEGTKEAPTKRWFKTVSTTGADHNINLTGIAPTEEISLGYSVFSADTIKVKPGQTFTFKANEGVQSTDIQYDLQWCTYRIWVDWNRDKVFAATAERIAEEGTLSAGTTAVVTINNSITVPADAAPGLTCMRVRYSDAWGPRPIPCGNILAGYTADIYILVEGTVVEPTPEPDPTPPAFNGPAINAPSPSVYLVYKLDGAAAGTASNLSLLLKKKGAAAPVAYPLGVAALEGWNEVNISLTDYSETDTIASIGLRVQASGDAPVKASIGELKLLPGTYERQKVTVSVAPTITDFAITTPITLSGADTLVDYGKELAFTFKAPAGQVPAVTVNDVPTLYVAHGADTYTVSIASVTEDLAVSIAARPSHTVTVSKPGAVDVVSASAPEKETGKYEVADGIAFAFGIKLNSAGYDAPKVAIGSTPYPLAPANAQGVYAITTGAISSDIAITITVALQRFAVSVAAGAHVALQTPASDTVTWGANDTIRFTLDEGYNPVVKVGGVEQAAPTPNADGAYVIAVSNVTAPVSVDIQAAIQQLNVTLTREQGRVALGEGTAAGTKTVAYGSSYPFSFQMATGYLPVLKVNGVEVAAGTKDASGLYRDTVHNITVATTIDITSKPDDGNGGEDPTGVSAVAADAPNFYPNPVNDVITFVNTDKASIYTVSGAPVGVYTEASVSIAHLPAGVYMVKMQRGSYTRTVRLVKN